MSLVIFFFGKPLSGKTTLVKKILARFPEFIHLNSDDIRRKYFDNPDGTNPIQNKKTFTELKKKMREAVLSNNDVLYDVTNSIREYRDKEIALVRESGGEVLIVDFRIPDVELEKRRLKRNQEKDSIKISADELKNWLIEPLSKEEAEIIEIDFNNLEESEKKLFNYLINKFL